MKKKNLNVIGFLLLTAFLLIEPFPVSAPEILAAEDATPQQEDKISLDLKSVDILELIRILSLKTGKTIVPSRDISGRITIFLNNVTFQDVLDIILISQGLASEKKGEIIYILTNMEYKAVTGRDFTEPRKMAVVKLTYAKPANAFNAISQIKSDIGKIVVDEASGTIILIDIPEKLELMQKTIKEIDSPLETAVYDLNYAKSADAKAQLTSAITPGTGEVIIDDRSGKAIISDLPQKMAKLKNIVKEIDEETRQVFIEADIIQITLSDSFKRGIDWEKLFSESKFHGLDFVGSFPVSPVLSTYQKISVGTVDSDKYKIIIHLLSQYGNTEVLSQPKIAVVNKEESNIMIGVRDAYVTQTLSQAESTTVTSEQVQFVDVGIKLKVVPTINKDGFITMKIKPEVSSVRETINTALGSRIPIVQTAEAETVIKIKDGTTIMLGGLLERTNIDALSGTPGLSRLPVFGPFFSTRSKEKKKTELIIFITPHLITGDAPRKGMEPEQFIPNQFMPDELRKKIMNQKLEEIEGRELEKAIIEKSAIKPHSELSPKSGAKNDKKKKTYPSQTVAYYKRGLAFQEAGNLEAAIKSYEKAIFLDSRCAPAYNQLGIIYESKHLPNNAERNYLKALEVDPEYLPVYSNLALLNEAKDDLDKAAHYWQQRLSLGDPNDLWTKAAAKRLEEINAERKAK